MGEHNTGQTSILVAQVRKATADHRVDPESGLLRAKSFPKPNKVVYLGDVAKAVLNCLDLPETPRFIQIPEFNEQKWSFITRSSDIEVTITSQPYWLFGLVNSGYLNIIELKGDFSSRCRIVFDLAAVLPQPPWEMAHLRSYNAFAINKRLPLFLENEKNWKRHIEHASEELHETIEIIQSKLSSSTLPKNEIEHVELELSFARKSLIDSNAPAVERALSRIEALLIGSNQHDIVLKETPSDELSIDVHLDQVPFVDYTRISGDSEE